LTELYDYDKIDSFAISSIPISKTASRQQFEAEISGVLPRDPALVLVTDLDGTLLGGSPESRRQLYGWLADQRQEVLHIFCTGRDRRAVRAMLDGGVQPPPPAPHLVIGDVGCTVACGLSLETVPMAVDPIEAQWKAVAPLVDGCLDGVAGLKRQAQPPERRYAYNYEPETFDPSILASLESLGVDCLLSDNQFLDLLPAGVNKGSTLMRLLQLLDLPPERVVTAGDTLNDLSMFQTGLKGVMVGNAESKLRALHPELKNIYLAQDHGCAGIIEGLRHFGMVAPD